jgi:hypothetical protein
MFGNKRQLNGKLLLISPNAETFTKIIQRRLRTCGFSRSMTMFSICRSQGGRADERSSSEAKEYHPGLLPLCRPNPPSAATLSPSAQGAISANIGCTHSSLPARASGSLLQTDPPLELRLAEDDPRPDKTVSPITSTTALAGRHFSPIGVFGAEVLMWPTCRRHSVMCWCLLGSVRTRSPSSETRTEPAVAARAEEDGGTDPCSGRNSRIAKQEKAWPSFPRKTRYKEKAI